MIRIIENKDPELLAALNHDVQEIHAEIEPGIFKKYVKEDMRRLFEDAFKNDCVYSYVAYFHDQPAGYVLISERDFPETYLTYAYKSLFIDQICVEKQYKGKNIGKELLNKVKLFAKEQGIKRIELDFWYKNNNAGEFFRSQGFNTFNERMYLEI
jgi:GNAT superfamily N-acetyltransferase